MKISAQACCNDRRGLYFLGPKPSLAYVSSSSSSSRRVSCEAWSELIAFADVVDPNMTLPVAASVLAYYLMPYYQVCPVFAAAAALLASRSSSCALRLARASVAQRQI
jgi:hypothetical protein